MFGLPTGDFIAGLMFLTVFGGTLHAWLKDRRDKAEEDGVTKTELRILNNTLAGMQLQLNEQNSSFQAHEIKCAEDKATIIADQRTIKATQTTIMNRLSSVQQQISNVALNLAPGRAMELREVPRAVDP